MISRMLAIFTKFDELAGLHHDIIIHLFFSVKLHLKYGRTVRQSLRRSLTVSDPILPLQLPISSHGGPNYCKRREAQLFTVPQTA